MRIASVVASAGLLGAGVGAFAAIRTATRLDRLHVRTDAAWAALDAALHRRALMASRAGTASTAVRCVAHEATHIRASGHARASGREELENELGRLLAALDRQRLVPACADRLADAEARVVIARRVYNDAVRDTLALRSHRMVRWLRLAGMAPLPRYFEIAEPALCCYELELDGAGA